MKKLLRVCGLAAILIALVLLLATVANAEGVSGLYKYEIVNDSYVKITDLAIEKKTRSM